MSLMFSKAFWPIATRCRRSPNPFFCDLDDLLFDVPTVIPQKTRMDSRSSAVDVQRKDGVFSFSVDAAAFKPEELEVNVVGASIVVEGSHSAESESGSVKRHFVQKIAIPADVDPESIRSSLLKDGRLRIEAKVKEAKDAEEEKRNIPIGITGAEEEAMK